jgi:hypothetical protein
MTDWICLSTSRVPDLADDWKGGPGGVLRKIAWLNRPETALLAGLSTRTVGIGTARGKMSGNRIIQFCLQIPTFT